jgi:hypothetical protein
MNTNTNTPALLLSSPAADALAFLREGSQYALAALSPFALREVTESAKDALARLREEVSALRDAADSAGAAFSLAFSRAPKSAAALALRDGAADLLIALALAERGARGAQALALALAEEWTARGGSRFADAEDADGAAEVSAALRAAAQALPAM